MQVLVPLHQAQMTTAIAQKHARQEWLDRDNLAHKINRSLLNLQSS